MPCFISVILSFEKTLGSTIFENSLNKHLNMKMKSLNLLFLVTVGILLGPSAFAQVKKAPVKRKPAVTTQKKTTTTQRKTTTTVKKQPQTVEAPDNSIKIKVVFG